MNSSNELAGANSIQTQMVFIEGKPTKRQRLSSPSGGISSSSGGDFASVPYRTITVDQIYNDSTEEEKKVASCLILLSQGDGPMKIEEGCKMERRLTTTSRRRHKKFKPTDNVCKNSPRPLNSNQTGNVMAGKMHECLMCGLEFGSGQALGGHMRKHKAVVVSTGKVALPEDERGSSVIAESSTRMDNIKKRNVLDLDLNLPVPEEDDHQDSCDAKFQFSATIQQAAVLVFSAPALVDCHY